MSRLFEPLAIGTLLLDKVRDLRRALSRCKKEAPMELELKCKRAPVTGGSRGIGIGKAIARRLAQQGADVALRACTAQALAAEATRCGAPRGIHC